MLKSFYERLEECLILIQSQTGLSRRQILLEAGIDPSQYQAYKRAERVSSKQMLIGITNLPNCPYSLDTLLAWQIVHIYGPGPIQEAQKILKKENRLIN